MTIKEAVSNQNDKWLYTFKKAQSFFRHISALQGIDDFYGKWKFLL